MTKALQLEGITKRFGRTLAVDRVSLQVEEGDFCVLLGPSGCGKSTLLRCIAGLESPDEGSIRIQGRRVDHLDPRDRDVAMVFQSYALYPHMSVEENLAFPLRMRGVPKAARADQVRVAAGMLRISDLLPRHPRELSGGQRQRVAMGRALVRNPSLFLFDEPLSNLDARLRAELRSEIARLHHRLGTTTVYVTHDQDEALTLGQTVVLMREGRVEQIGSPRDLYERPASVFAAGFLGSPPMNLIPGEIRQGAFRSSGLEVNAGLSADGPATLGIRPEHVVLGEGSMQGTVALTEWHGPNVVMHLDWGETTLRALAESVPSARPGESLRFGIPSEKVHFFPGDPRPSS